MANAIRGGDQQLTSARNFLRALGFDLDSLPDAATLETDLRNNTDIADAIDETIAAVNTLSNTDTTSLEAADRMAEQGLSGSSNDLAVALSIADSEIFSTAVGDRDFLKNVGIDVIEAGDRLALLGLDGDSTDEEIAVALVNQTDLLTPLSDGLDLLADNPDVLTDSNLLSSSGLSGSSSDTDINLVADPDAETQLNTDLKAARDRVFAADAAVVDAATRFFDLGLTIEAGDVTVAPQPAATSPVSEVQVHTDGDFGSFTLTFDGETTAEIAHDATADEVEATLEDLGGLTDVTVTGGGTSADPWVIGFVTPADHDPALISADATGLLTRDTAASSTVDPLVQADADRLAVLGLGADSTVSEIAAVAGAPAVFAARLADRDVLAAFEDAKLVSISFLDSQLFVGFNIDAGLSTTVSPDLEGFLRSVGLPDAVGVEFDADLLLEGNLDLDFAVGIDLGSLEDGISNEDLFLQLNEFVISGGISTDDLDFGLSFGPLGANVTDAVIDLDAGVRITLDGGDDNTVSLAELSADLIDVSLTAASLDAVLPLSLSVGGATAAETLVEFHTDDLFGDISNLLDGLPSLEDLSNISIDQVIAGIRTAMNYVEGVVLGTDEVHRVGHDGNAGAYTLTFDGETTTNLAHDADAAAVKAALLALDGGNLFADGDLDVQDVSDGFRTLFDITFQGEFANIDVDQITIDVSSLTADEVQRVGHDADGGAYTLTFEDAGGATYTTVDLTHDNDATIVKNALLALNSGALFASGDLDVQDVSEGSSTLFRITFQGAFADLDVNQITVDAASLTLTDGTAGGVEETLKEGGVVDATEETRQDGRESGTGDIPLVSEYLEDALSVTRTALDAVENLDQASPEDIQAVEDFLEDALSIVEIQFQRVFHNGATGDLTLAFEGDESGETFTINADDTATEVQAKLEVLTFIQPANPGDPVDVEVTGSGTADDPWEIRFIGPRAEEDVPNLLIVANTLLDADTQEAIVTLEADRNEHLDVSLDDGAIVFDLGYNFGLERTTLPFEFALAKIANLIGGPIGDLLAGADDLIDLEGSGNLEVEFEGRLDLVMGFDPGGTLGTAIFIGDSTELTVDAFIHGDNLNFEANINIGDALGSITDLLGGGVVSSLTDSLGDLLESLDLSTVGIKVVDGTVRLDAGVDEDGDGELDPARFHFVLEADDVVVDGEDGSGDGRYTIGELSDALIAENTGEIEVNLPLFFPTEALPMGGTTDDLDGDGIPDNVLHIEVTDLTDIGGSLDVVTPDIKGSIGLFALLNNIDITTIIAGPGVEAEEEDNPFKAGILGTLENIFRGDLFGIELPFIGDALESGADFIGNFRDQVRTVLDDLSGGTGSPVDIVQGGLFEVFGNILGLLGDENDDGVVDKNDILVTGDARHVQFDIRLSDPDLFSADIPLDFGGAIPGLGLEFSDDAGIELKVGYDFSFGFGFSLDDGFYFDTSNVDELEVNIEAKLSDGFASEITLGFLTLEVIDKGILDLVGDPSGSGFLGKFFVDIKDPGLGTKGNANGRLTFSEIRATRRDPNSSIIAAGFKGKAEANLGAGLGIADLDALPKITTDFYYSQEFGVGAGAPADPRTGETSFGSAPIIEFRDVQINLTTFLGGVLGPVFGEIQNFTKPFQPLLDILLAPVPIVDTLLPGPTVTFLTLGAALGGLSPGFTLALTAIAEMINGINSIDTSGGDVIIDFGTFVVGGAGHDFRDADNDLAKAGDDDKVGGSASTHDEAALKSKVAAKEAGGKGAGTGGLLGKIKNAGITLPFLTDPKQVFGLLSGDLAGVTFIEWDIPALKLDFVLQKSVPIFPGLNARFFGDVKVVVDFAIGYDGIGIQRLLDGGTVLDVFDGFFIKDTNAAGVDVPEVTFDLTIGAGASLGIGGLVEVGVEGGITASIDLDLHDLPIDPFNPDGPGDGRIRFDEISKNLQLGPHCIFELDGQLDVFLRAFLWVGVDLGFFGKVTLFDETFEFLRETIVDFHLECPPIEAPILATQVGGELFLNMGSRAGDRVNVNTVDGDETFIVDQVTGDDGVEYITVRAFGFTQGAVNDKDNLPPPEFLFKASEISKIVVLDGGSGNDTITINASVDTAVDLSGGLGVDKIEIKGSGDATIRGGAGNDVLLGGTGANLIEGGGDDDFIRGGDAADTIYGGAQASGANSGADTIEGGLGADLIFGGDEAVSIVNDRETGGDRISGGEGADTIHGGAGADIILGNEDADLIFGDANADRILGNEGDDTIEGGAGEDILAGGLGVDDIEGQAGDDVINWAKGDGDDSFISGGGDLDSFFVTGEDAPEVITVSQAGTDNFNVAWSGESPPTSLTASDIENLILDMKGGADQVTVQDLVGSGVDDMSIDLGRLETVTETVTPIIDEVRDVARITGVFSGFVGLKKADGSAAGVTAVTTREADVINNELQEISHDAQSGSFTLTLEGKTTGRIAHDATAADVQATINALSNRNVNEVQQVSHNGTAGDFTLTFDGQTTGSIAHDATTADVQAALEGLSNLTPGDVDVTGTGAGRDPWLIEFQGAKAGLDVPEITADDSGLTGEVAVATDIDGIPPVVVTGSGTAGDPWEVEFVDSAGGEVPQMIASSAGLLKADDTPATFTVETVAEGGDANEIQRISHNGTAGDLTLSFGAETTGPIAFDATAADVQAALEALSGIGAGNVEVTGTGTAADPWRVEFTGTKEAQNLGQITADDSGLTGTATVETFIDGQFGVDEVQRIFHDGGQGTFTLSFEGETTAAIAHDATAADVKAALEGLPILDVGDVTVTGSGTAENPWVVTFLGTVERNIGFQVEQTTNSAGDAAGDTVILHGGAVADDVFSVIAGADEINITREGVMNYSLKNAERPTGDLLKILTFGGEDTIDASGSSRTVDPIAMNFIGGGDDDRLIGSHYDDTLDSGLGDDTVSGNAGTDVFIDAGGIDTLAESQDLDMSLFDDTFVAGKILGDDGSVFTKGNSAEDEDKLPLDPLFPAPFITELNDTGDVYASTYTDTTAEIARNVQVEDLGGLFEKASLFGGASNNILVVGDRDNTVRIGGADRAVSDWSGEVNLDNFTNNNSQNAVNTQADRNEYYILNLKGDTGADYNIADTGGTDGTDEVYVFGTLGDDKFSLNATGGGQTGVVIAGEPFLQVQKTDLLGRPVFNQQVTDAGEPVFTQDLRGNEVPVFEQATDGGGNPLFVDGEPILVEVPFDAALDAQDRLIPIFLGTAQKKDDAGNPLYNIRVAAEEKAFDILKRDRDLLAVNPQSVSPLAVATTARLTAFGLDETATDTQIGVALADDTAADSLGIPGEMSKILRADRDLVAAPGGADPVLVDAASDRLAAIGLDGTSTNQEILTALTDSPDLLRDEIGRPIFEQATEGGVPLFRQVPVLVEIPFDSALDDQGLLFPVLERVENPDRETVTFRGAERLQIHTLDGNDSVLSDDNTVQTLINFGEGNDELVIGTVPLIPDTGNRTIEFPDGIPVADTRNMTNGVSAELIALGKGGNDTFEVNHNAAKLYLHGGKNDDRFVINTFIALRDNPDEPDEISNLASLFGESGNNRYEYVQNAPVFLQGGDGIDTVVINGTPIGDTFVVTETIVAGAGRIIYFTGMERVEINGAAGDDEIYILSTSTDFETIVRGGSGDDKIHLGGKHPTLILDPPEFIYQPPPFQVQDPPVVDYRNFTYDPGRWTIYVSESVFTSRNPFNFNGVRQEVTRYIFKWLTSWEFQPFHDILVGDPANFPRIAGSAARAERDASRANQAPNQLGGIADLVQRTLPTIGVELAFRSWWWNRRIAGLIISFDIPRFEYRYGTQSLPPLWTIQPEAVRVDPPAFAFQADAVFDVSDIKGRLTIDGGEAFEDDGGDQVIVHNQESGATTGSITTKTVPVNDVRSVPVFQTNSDGSVKTFSGGQAVTDAFGNALFYKGGEPVFNTFADLEARNPVLDSDGEVVTHAKGDPILRLPGEPVPVLESRQVQGIDADGNLKFDASGNPILETGQVPKFETEVTQQFETNEDETLKLDTAGNPIPKTKTFFSLEGLTGTGTGVDFVPYSGVEFLNFEDMEIRFGDQVDDFTIDDVPDGMTLDLIMGGGDDRVRVKKLTSETTILGGAGNDTVDVFDDGNAVGAINAKLTFDGDAHVKEVLARWLKRELTAAQLSILTNAPRVFVNTSPDLSFNSANALSWPELLGINESALPAGDGFVFAREQQAPIVFEVNPGEEFEVVPGEFLGNTSGEVEIWAYTVVLDPVTGFIIEDNVQERGVHEKGVQETQFNLDLGAEELLFLDADGNKTAVDTGVPSFVTDFVNGVPLYLERLADGRVVKTAIAANAIKSDADGSDVKSFVATTDGTGILLWLDEDGNRVDFVPPVKDSNLGLTFVPRPSRVPVNRTKRSPIEIPTLVDETFTGNDTLNVVNSGDPKDITGTLAATTLDLESFDAGENRVPGGFGTNGIIEFANLDDINITLDAEDVFTIESTHTGDVTLNTGGNKDTVNVKSISGDTTINTQGGDDIINVGNDSNRLEDIDAVLTIVGGADTDEINIHDDGESAGQSGVLSGTRLTGFGMGGRIDYASAEDLNLSLGSGGDTLTVTGTHAGTTDITTDTPAAGSGDTVNVQAISGVTTIETGSGGDTVNVGHVTNGLQGITRDLFLIADGAAPFTDTLNVSDAGNSTGRTGRLDDTKVTGLGMGGDIDYSAFEFVNVGLGKGNDIFTVDTTINGVTTISGGTGIDKIKVETLNGASISMETRGATRSPSLTAPATPPGPGRS